MCRSCPLHVIVRASFEWREIDNLLRSFGVRLPAGSGDSVIGEAVALAHEDLAFSKHLTRMLCLVHGETIATVAETSLELLGALPRAPLDPDTDVPALWGLIVDRRPQTSRLAWAWLRRSRATSPTPVETPDPRDP